LNQIEVGNKAEENIKVYSAPGRASKPI